MPAIQRRRDPLQFRIESAQNLKESGQKSGLVGRAAPTPAVFDDNTPDSVCPIPEEVSR